LPECLTQTAEQLNKGIRSTEFAISSDLKEAIMCNGARTANNTAFGHLWDLYTESSKASEKKLLLKSMGCIQNREILKNYINTYKKVGDDEWFTVIQAIYLNGPIGLNVTMEFLESSYIEFNDL
jgi:hypothetical protein